ncbi:hypothetical protein BTZ20_0019 [Rhodococcus sp. MTM3W5.2]|nr:hypothetical protein BTZ20_0019 [Rhodococcus sp. MTM3W5.2]
MAVPGALSVVVGAGVDGAWSVPDTTAPAPPLPATVRTIAAMETSTARAAVWKGMTDLR